jgi:hypothetical protein
MTAPSEQPADRPFSQSDALDSYLIVIDGPLDRTRRPRRPGIPYTPPDGVPTPPERRDRTPPANEVKEPPGDVPPAG